MSGLQEGRLYKKAPCAVRRSVSRPEASLNGAPSAALVAMKRDQPQPGPTPQGVSMECSTDARFVNPAIRPSCNPAILQSRNPAISKILQSRKSCNLRRLLQLGQQRREDLRVLIVGSAERLHVVLLGQ